VIGPARVCSPGCGGGWLVGGTFGAVVATAQAGSFTTLCRYEFDYVVVTDYSGAAHTLSAGYRPSDNKIRVDALNAQGDPSSCTNPEPWGSFTFDLGDKGDTARLDARGLPKAYKPLPKGIEAYLNGEGGADTLIGHSGYDQVTGGGGADTIKTGAGADQIEPGPGKDRVAAGRGGDGIDAVDGTGGDRIKCGKGFDLVGADPGDKVDDDCELVG
jgi:Ca2+-binding RTX toxin-like protein